MLVSRQQLAERRMGAASHNNDCCRGMCVCGQAPCDTDTPACFAACGGDVVGTTRRGYVLWPCFFADSASLFAHEPL